MKILDLSASSPVLSDPPTSGVSASTEWSRLARQLDTDDFESLSEARRRAYIDWPQVDRDSLTS